MYLNFSTPVPTVSVILHFLFFLLGIIFMTRVFSQLMLYFFMSLHLNAGTELDSPVSEFRSRQARRKQKSLSDLSLFETSDLLLHAQACTNCLKFKICGYRSRSVPYLILFAMVRTQALNMSLFWWDMFVLTT